MARKTITSTVEDFRLYVDEQLCTFRFNVPATATNTKAVMSFHVYCPGQQDIRVVRGTVYSTTYSVYSISANYLDRDISFDDVSGRVDFIIQPGQTEQSFIIRASKPQYATFTNVTLTISYDESEHNITVDNGANGSLVCGVSSAVEGTNILLSASPNTGFSLSGVTSVPAVDFTINGNAVTFTMPDEDIVITPVWHQNVYNLTMLVEPANAGTVSFSADSLVYGAEVSVTQAPVSGYVFHYWIGANVVDRKFIMPAADVVLTARYYARSTATLSSNMLTGGSSVMMNIQSEKSNYSHTYSIDFGGGMATAEIAIPAGTTSVSVPVPKDWCYEVTNATTKTGGTLTLKTYDGQNMVGSYAISGLTYVVPDSVKPSVNEVTTEVLRTIDGKTYADVGNVYVQNHSGVTVSVLNASGAYGSTISSITVTVNGQPSKTYTGTTAVHRSQLLATPGSTMILVKVTDSRGRSASTISTINVYPYTAPVITGFSVWRVDEAGDADFFGEYAQYSKSHTFSRVGNNALTTRLIVQGENVLNAPDSGDLVPGNRLSFNILFSYDVELQISDKFESTSSIIRLPSANFILHFNAQGNAVAVGETAQVPDSFTISERMSFRHGNKKLVYNDDGSVTWVAD